MEHLVIHYEGYWQCRQATDPDPSRDPRGASGFTWAVGYENDLDQIIRLQRDEIPPCDFREAPEPYYPPGHPTREFGIWVTGVQLNGRPFAPAEDILRGGKIRWLPVGDPLHGPRFDLRNTITYYPNPNGIFMPIVPFTMQVESGDGRVRIRRHDPVDPAHPKRPVWQMGNWQEYAGRCPVNWWDISDETMAAINVSATGANSFSAYFQKRKEWLELRRSQTAEPVAREAYTNRLRVIEAFSTAEVGYRLEMRLGMRAEWAFPLRGGDLEVVGETLLGGRIVPDQVWPVRFWMGAFDGDVMRGYLRGTWTLPFEPRAA